MEKKICKHKNIKAIIKRFGYDWTNLILEKPDFRCENLMGIKLPYDTELFHKIMDKALSATRLPKGDYSAYNFYGLDVRCCRFTYDSLLPENEDFFSEYYV